MRLCAAIVLAVMFACSVMTLHTEPVTYLPSLQPMSAAMMSDDVGAESPATQPTTAPAEATALRDSSSILPR